MPRGEHFYKCLDCGQQKRCGDAIPLFCPQCAKKPKACRRCGREEPQDLFGFTSVCSVCWAEGNPQIAEASSVQASELRHQ